MNRIVETISIRSIEDLPTLDKIKSISRKTVLKLVFEENFQSERETIGSKLKEELTDSFQVGIHMIEPVINNVSSLPIRRLKPTRIFSNSVLKTTEILGLN